MHHILLVEDSEEFQKLVTRSLNEHAITCVDSAESALAALSQQKFDLILLDIQLPKKSGYDFLAEMQTTNQSSAAIPIMCLTGKAEVTDKVTAFSLGAEDYILKPCNPLELRARVNAKLKKQATTREVTFIQAADLEIDTTSHRVNVVAGAKRQEIVLTQTEFKLLCCLAKAMGRVYTRDQLLVAAWGEDARVNDRVVDVHLCSLRKKLGARSSYIRAVPGVGYKFEAVKKAA